MKYNVVLADPPWEYTKSMPQKTGTRNANEHYPTMSTIKIAALPTEKMIGPNAVLFLWVTWPKLFDAEYVIDAWGFDYKTIAWVWIKSNPNGFGFFTGMGHYTRSNSEPCLLAVKGSMPVESHSIQSLIYSAVREHSKKPEDQYRKIETLYPGKKYLELFARRAHPGWDVWGNEVPNSVELSNGKITP